MTTATDSETPNSQPANTMTVMTEVTMKATQRIVSIDWIQFIVANITNTNANAPDSAIPCTAFYKKALSEIIQHHTKLSAI